MSLFTPLALALPMIQTGRPHQVACVVAQRGDGERRTRTADTTIFSGGATNLARHAEASKKARVCGHFARPPATVAGQAARRDTGGYPKMPGGLGRRAGFIGPNETGPVVRMARDVLEPPTPRFAL